VPRYRYPADPLLAVLAAGGVMFLVKFGRRLLRRSQTPVGPSA